VPLAFYSRASFCTEKRFDILIVSPVFLENLISVALGLVVGSFLNVVIVRLPQEKSIVFPGSHCPKCQAKLHWYENIPVFSYLALRGRCRGCKDPISVRYPIVELITALLFITVKIKFGFSWLLFARDWPFISILVAVTFIDLEHRIIPDELSLGGLVLGLATAYWTQGLGLPASLIGASVGFGAFYGLAWIYLRLTKKSGLGGGDIKLLAMIGAFLGIGGVFAAILISSVFGSVVGIGWALISRKEKVMAVAIPYGPFLVVGALYYYLLGDLLWFQFTTPT
jgi:leader peptidase (prepilin peptidase)/N-methyltransferase